MNPRAVIACAGCAFFHAYPRRIVATGAEGECRHSPPVREGDFAYWPEVCKREWCGMWKQRGTATRGEG